MTQPFPDLGIEARRLPGVLPGWHAELESAALRGVVEKARTQNARLVAHAERYYRTMYYGSRSSWNLRDSYMFDTLKVLREHHWPDNKAVIWAHNSHLGDSAATEMSSRGEFNIGHLCRKEFGNEVYSIGFGTDHGTVAAASEATIWPPWPVEAIRKARCTSTPT